MFTKILSAYSCLKYQVSVPEPCLQFLLIFRKSQHAKTEMKNVPHSSLERNVQKCHKRKENIFLEEFK